MPLVSTKRLHPRNAMVTLCLLVPLCVHCRNLGAGMNVTHKSAVNAHAHAFQTDVGRERLASTNPLAFLKMCQEHYQANVEDYRCRFNKQERINGELKPEQVINVRFREVPLSVDMRWIENGGRASRVTYVAGRWRKDGQDLALVRPSGVFGLLLPGGVKRDIHSADMTSSSRKSIDQFGFNNSLTLITKYCDLATGEAEYALNFHGIETLDGRPCFVFERKLPYTGLNGIYPDRMLKVYIDQEWLVPTGCFAYSDDHGADLLGKYILTAVEFNVGLSDKDF